MKTFIITIVSVIITGCQTFHNDFSSNRTNYMWQIEVSRIVNDMKTDDKDDHRYNVSEESEFSIPMEHVRHKCVLSDDKLSVGMRYITCDNNGISIFVGCAFAPNKTEFFVKIDEISSYAVHIECIDCDNIRGSDHKEYYEKQCKK